VARVGLRLQLRRAQAAAGEVVLWFGDESEALTHPYLAHAWAERGADLRVQAPGQARKVAMLGVLDAVTRRALVPTSPTKRSADFAALLERLDRAYGPAPGQARRSVVLVLDNGPIHTNKATAKALAARPWRAVEGRPRYAPERNPIEGTGRDLKRHHLAHRTFRDAGDLDRAIHHAVAEINQERAVRHPCHNLPSAA
jgi:transposase